jgi:hypothetical protein
VTLETGTATANSTQSTVLNGAATVGITVTGSFVAGSTGLVPELSYDGGTTWAPVANMTILGPNPNDTTATGSQKAVTAPGLFAVDATAATNFRLRAATFTSGTATVKFSLSSNRFNSLRVFAAGINSGGSPVVFKTDGNGLLSVNSGGSVQAERAETPVLTANANTAYTAWNAGNQFGASNSAYFNVHIYGDQASAANGVIIEESTDGSTGWHTYTAPSSLVASTPLNISVKVTGTYYRVRVINGTTAFGTLYIVSSFSAG